MARKIYYKVVCKNTLKSFDGSMQYAKDRWVVPKLAGSKLAVFASLNAAKQYVRHDSESIYECYVKAPINPYQYRAVVYSGYYNDIQKYWEIVAKAQKAKKNISKALKQAGFYREWPSDTVLCNSVMLLKSV